MRRRTYLGAVSTTTLASLAGCSALDESEPEGPVVLSHPEDQGARSAELSYPAYGQALPDFRLRDPLRDEWVDTEDLDRTTLLTAIFTYCPQECLLITQSLVEVQYDVNEADLGDDVVFLVITFDPERDDAASLEEYAEMNRVDRDAGNWHFLRPEDDEEAERIVNDRLGIPFERIGDSDRVDTYDFAHVVVTLLVNPDGYVERAYRGDRPDTDRIFEDVRTVVDEY